MDLKTYCADMKRRTKLAAAVGTSPLWLYQIATSWRGKRPSIELALKIQRATRGKVRADSMLPELKALSRRRA